MAKAICLGWQNSKRRSAGENIRLTSTPFLFVSVITNAGIQSWNISDMAGYGPVASGGSCLRSWYR